MSILLCIIIYILTTDIAVSYSSTVRFWDPGTKLALIRTSREGSTQVRATLTLTCHPFRLHVKSVHGSTRTLQMAAMRCLQQEYKNRIVQGISKVDCCIELEQHFQSIQQLE